MKIYKNKNGFTVVETLLTILILAVIGFGGYYVWHTQDNKVKTVSTTTETSTSPYAGWKTATLKYEKITYQYPANWKITDYSSPGGCTTPGSDLVYLTSPNNEQVVLHTGIDCIGDGGAVDFGTAVPITALGQNLYLVFQNWAGEGPADQPSVPQFACLGPTSSPNTPFDFIAKNIFHSDYTSASDKATQNSFCYYTYNNQSKTPLPAESVSSIENSHDFTTAELIFESMHY